MLMIEIKAETGNDKITPINIASSIIGSGTFDLNELEELSEHLRAYTSRIRNQKFDQRNTIF